MSPSRHSAVIDTKDHPPAAQPRQLGHFLRREVLGGPWRGAEEEGRGMLLRWEVRVVARVVRPVDPFAKHGRRGRALLKQVTT